RPPRPTRGCPGWSTRTGRPRTGCLPIEPTTAQAARVSLFPPDLPALAVDLAEDRVKAPDYGHQVRNQEALADHGDQLQVDEGRLPPVEAVGLVAPVADQVAAHLALGAFGAHIGLTLHLPAAGEGG